MSKAKDQKGKKLKMGDHRTFFGCKRCCKTDLKLGNMGHRAVVSHMQSKNHVKAEKHHESIKTFFHKHSSANKSNPSQTAISSSASTPTSNSQDKQLQPIQTPGAINVDEIENTPGKFPNYSSIRCVYKPGFNSENYMVFQNCSKGQFILF